MTYKGFITDYRNNKILPITRAELVLDKLGNIAFHSDEFLATTTHAGLISAAEKALLDGTNGQGFTDIYTKLGYINEGIKIGENVLNFYNSDGPTPINIIESTGISIGVANNVISIALSELLSEKIDITEGIIKNITVDKYGRVTSVSIGDLTNDDIPYEISEKKLSNCIATNIDDDSDNLAIANKKYVDDKFTLVNNIAAGGLKFGGIIDKNSLLSELLTNTNNYYKVVENLIIDSSNIYPTTNVDIIAKIGDTLIVYKDDNVNKFVHIPSGDDITTITAVNNDIPIDGLNNLLGNVVLNFKGPIYASKENNNSDINISITSVSSTTDGYLSKEDYNEFKDYKNSLKVEYIGEITQPGNGIYEIGTLKIGNSEEIIYGKNNISELSLNNGTNNDPINPILKFKETGSDDVEITIKGLSGILSKKNNNVIEISSTNEVIDQSTSVDGIVAKYLTIEDGYKFGVKLGKITSTGEIDNGLTDFRQHLALALTTNYSEYINYSLSGDANNNEYRYGNLKLIDAITF